MDLVQNRAPAAIFHDVVKKRGDRFLLITAGFKNKCGHAHQVRDVRDARLLARLQAMLLSRKKKCFLEARSQLYGR